MSMFFDSHVVTENEQCLRSEWSNNESNMVRADISKIIMHEDYNSQTTDYDFALLKLKTKIDWTATPHIRPVCLPSADAGDFTGDTAYVTGK